MLFVLMLISAMANIAILGIAVKYVRSLSTSDSREDDEVEIVWAKATRGGWGLGQVFEDKLFFYEGCYHAAQHSPRTWNGVRG